MRRYDQTHRRYTIVRTTTTTTTTTLCLAPEICRCRFRCLLLSAAFNSLHLGTRQDRLAVTSMIRTTHTTQTPPRERERGENGREEYMTRQRREERGEKTEDTIPKTQDRRHKTEDRRHKTEDRRRHKTEDRRQKTEERGERREDERRREKTREDERDKRRDQKIKRSREDEAELSY